MPVRPELAQMADPAAAIANYTFLIAKDDTAGHNLASLDAARHVMEAVVLSETLLGVGLTGDVSLPPARLPA